MINKEDTTINIKGIDLSSSAISWVRMINHSIEFEVKDVSDEKGKWSAIPCVEVIEHIPGNALDCFFCRMAGVLDDYGKIYITVPSNNLQVSKKHYRHYNFELLEEQIEHAKCGLEVIEENYIVPNVTRIDPIIMRLGSNNYWNLACFD